MKQWKNINQNDSMLSVLYRDGIVFFIFLFAMSLSSFSLQMGPKLSPLYNWLLPELERVLRSLLTSKIILHLREFTIKTPGYETVAINDHRSCEADVGHRLPSLQCGGGLRMIQSDEWFGNVDNAGMKLRVILFLKTVTSVVTICIYAVHGTPWRWRGWSIHWEYYFK